MKNFTLKLFWILSLVHLATGNLHAQQEAMYSQYMFNGLAINPAYAGVTENLSAAALYRKQWVGVEGAPSTQTFSAHAPANKKRLGLGLTIINDKIGITNNVAINGIYALRIKTEEGIFSMGLQTGIGQYLADYSQVKTSPDQIADPTFSERQNSALLNAGFGLFYNTEKFYAGASIPYLVSREIYSLSNSTLSSPHHYRHVFLTSGYVFTLSPSLKLKPSYMVKISEGAPIQADINTNLWIHDIVSTGVSYRTGDALIGMFEFQLSRQLRLGYAYDHPFSNTNRYLGGSHEVILRFDLVLRHTKYVSPRYF